VFCWFRQVTSAVPVSLDPSETLELLAGLVSLAQLDRSDPPARLDCQATKDRPDRLEVSVQQDHKDPQVNLVSREHSDREVLPGPVAKRVTLVKPGSKVYLVILVSLTPYSIIFCTSVYTMSMSMSMSMSIYIAHYRTVTLMRLMR